MPCWQVSWQLALGGDAVCVAEGRGGQQSDCSFGRALWAAWEALGAPKLAQFATFAPACLTVPARLPAFALPASCLVLPCSVGVR